MSGWGSDRWGVGAWGGASLVSLQLIGAIAVRENVVRLVFSQPVYYSKIFDRYDASNAVHYAMTPVNGSLDGNEEPTRAVRVVDVALPDTTSNPPVLQGEIGFFIDIMLDRPMSSYPASYMVGITDLQNADGSSQLPIAVAQVDAAYRELQPASFEIAAPIRDFANPQTSGALANAGTDEMSALATYVASDDGDYAFDEGSTGRKKRVLRRLITKKNGFAHLPGYGLGILSYGKRLARIDAIGKLTTDARLQVQKEPDVAKAIVGAEVGSQPSLVRLNVGIKPKGGRSQKFTISIPVR